MDDPRDGQRLIRNTIGWRERLARLQGFSVERDLRSYDEPLGEICRQASELERLSDAEFGACCCTIANAARAGTPLHSLRLRAYALVREAARRTIGLWPFDVQVVAALALDRGRVVEMQTGEGKTLAAVMPASLNALIGKGVHVLTFNDYLAQRDAEWMGPVYRLLGLSVAYVQGGMSPEQRRDAYWTDVTYVTAKEAGFDHLRDQLATHAAHLMHRPFHFALVDEADSLLIDEARIPLVIAGNVERDASAAAQMARLVGGLQAGVHFDTDPYGRDVELTDAGIERAEQALGCGSLHSEKNYLVLTELNCALHARALLKRDVHYIVRDGRIQLVDEFTGRVVKDRLWPDGLQAALEAKEGLERASDGRILGSITLQHFLAGYPRLCGMTGTAQDAARELEEFYGLAVVVIPTHRPLIRVDRADVLFTHRGAKETALVEEIRRAHAAGRPVLVGTLSVEESERLAARLRAAAISCEVLNAKNDAMEAALVARAGSAGAVTISTNMAGRGTDIRLGGADEAERQRVMALGGLYVIGTNRHESRRVDLQLRGRAGRQGDPGESRFFVSLEDELLVRHGVRRLIPSRFLPEAREEPIDNPVVRSEIARAQRIIEGQNLEIRRTLRRYATPVEEQQRLVHERRQAALLGLEPGLWREHTRFKELAATIGTQALERAETAVTLFEIDRAWSDHLSFAADLREGIHLVRLGGDDPLTRFRIQISEAFRRMVREIDAAVVAALEKVEASPAGLALPALGIKRPSSTWTYLVNDDPFRDQLGMSLIGPGKTTFAIGAAISATPLLLLLGFVDRFFRKRPRRGHPTP